MLDLLNFCFCPFVNAGYFYQCDFFVFSLGIAFFAGILAIFFRVLRRA